MPDIQDIVKLAIDGHRGSVDKYSVQDSQETLRKALVDLNGGSTKLNYKNIRDGKCNGLFTLIEIVVDRIIIDSLQNDDFFMSMVEFRNLAEGDAAEFEVEDGELFAIDKVANGTQGIRRQRLTGYSTFTVPTQMRMVRIYEELNRVLSGRVDFNHMIDVVGRSFSQNMLNDIYTLWSTATYNDFGGEAYFPAAGSFSEGTLLDTIAHVEAAAGGKTATLIGTKKALRAISGSIASDLAKDSLYNMGYVGKFYGSPVVAMPQRHRVGTTDFVFDDNIINIVAGDDKPIKFVYEGDPIIIMGNPLDNADLTQEYLYGSKYGMGLILASGNTGIGRYTMSAPTT